MQPRRSVPPEPALSPNADAGAKTGHTITSAAVANAAGGAFVTRSPQDAWTHFRPRAQQVVTEDLAPLKTDPALARHNIAVGLAAVTPFFDRLPARCPEIAVRELIELPALALALEFAVGRVPTEGRSKQEIAERLRAVKQPREDALVYLGVAARQGLVPEERVRTLRDGGGKLHAGRTSVQIVGLFREFEGELRGRHPFPEKFLQDLAENGAWLMSAIKPGRARHAPAQRSPEAIERDQFAKLLADGHEKLRVAGVVLFGLRALDEKVPPLYSGTREVAVEEVEEGDENSEDEGDDVGGDAPVE